MNDNPGQPISAVTSGVLRRHAVFLAIALAFAALIVAPRWYLLWTDPPEGVRVQVDPGGAYGIGWDEPLYVPGMREAFEGRLPVRDAYLSTNQDDPPLTFSWWQEAIGILGHVTGGNIFYAFALVATAAAAAGFVLLYVLAYEITGSRWVAVACIPPILIFAQVIYQAQGFLPLRHWDVLQPLITINPPGEFHTWYRFLAPSVPLPIAFACVLALKRAFEQRSRAWTGVAAAAIALLIYTNPFFWIALLLAVALWGALLLYERDFDAVRRLAVICAVAMLLALPELVFLVWNSVSVPYEVKSRSGLGHLGIEWSLRTTIAQRVLFLAPFAWFAWRGPRINRFFVALSIAPLMLAGTRGVVPQVDHFLYQSWLPLSLPLLLAGTVAFSDWAGHRWDRPVAVGLAVLAVVGTLYAGAFQVRAIGDLDGDYAVRPDEAAALAWIRENVQDEETVVSPSRSTNYLLTSLTSAYVYVPYGSSAVGTRASDDEIIERYFRASAAFGYSAEDTMYRLSAQNGIPRPRLDDEIAQPDIERYVERSMVDYLLNEVVDRPREVERRTPGWQAEYQSISREDDVLSPFPADYIYCSPRERLWNGTAPAPGIFVETAFAQGDTVVYRILPPGGPSAEEFQGCNAATHVK